MKKPKFNQLRGTYAHTLRHRICFATTLASFVISVGAYYGTNLILGEHRTGFERYAKKLSEHKRDNWLSFFKVEDGPEL